ncbi:MAG: tRNA modification gtpase trme [Bacteroidetes bacterium]|nr:tRNA modification gtpase trme [Bacteroidota bacterium]
MKLRSSDTIAAIATPLGEGAISVVRVSGPDAIALADKAFRGNHTLCETQGYTIRYGRIVDSQNETVDQVLVSVFRSPNSYTGEDSVEISCHGGVFVTKKVLSTVIGAGSRQADPGEFTKRAFVNGKMDLSQAEAVADLIRAGSERAHRNSTAQLSGSLSQCIRSIRAKLMETCVLVEVQLDFSEDDIPVESSSAFKQGMIDCKQELESLLTSFRAGRLIRDGASVVIVGRPNVGKSSLFNRLLMSNRSIVSSKPGTTRDFLEESILLDGTLIKLVDTAGLRVANDDVEAEGIARTREAVRGADLVVLVIDATEEPTLKDDLETIADELRQDARVVVALNKVDRLTGSPLEVSNSVPVSALTGEGIEELKERISKLVTGDIGSQDSEVFICSNRHNESIQNCLNHVVNGLKSIEAGMTGEFVAADLRLASESLSEVTGEITTDEILNEVFSKFCIGK